MLFLNKILIIIIVCVASSSYAADYYISDISGDDLNDGSFQNPWKSISKLSTHSFQSGDHIYFERGNSFSGSITFTLQGLANNPIIIDAYGSGNKPHFIGSSTHQSVFRMVNCKGVELRNLHFSAFYPSHPISERYGIDLSPNLGAGDLEYVHLINLDFSNIQGSSNSDHMSCGIYGLIPDENNNYQNTRWNNLLIDNCTFVNIDGIATFIKDQCYNIADVIVRETDTYYPTEGFIFQNNYGTNCYRNLLRINGCKGAIAQYNTMDTTQKGSGIWPFASEDTLIQYNLFMRTRNPETDSFVCHFDYNCRGTVMQYNIGYDIDGGLVELICASQYNRSFQTGAIARYNLGIDVGFRDTENAAGILISGNVDGGYVYNNTVITYDKPQYKAISFKNWGGAWPSNNIICNNIFYALGTESTHLNQIRGIERGNQIGYNMYAGNISPPVTWNQQQVDLYPYTGDPKFINPYTSDFLSNLSSNPNWDEVVQYLSKKFKVGYNSDAINPGYRFNDHPDHDFYSNSTVSINGIYPTLGYHDYYNDNYVDSDLDKMPDVWEIQYGSILNPEFAADKWQDADGDGVVNFEEFVFMGNPLDAQDNGFQGDYTFTLIDGELVAQQILPIRKDWDTLGLSIDTYWASNLNQVVWSVADSTIVALSSNQFASGVNAQTNEIEVIDNVDAVFYKTIVR